MDLKTSAATEMGADAPCGYQLTDGLSEGPTGVSRQSVLDTPLPHVGRGCSSGLQFRWAKARPPFKAPFALSWAILAYILGIVAIIYFCRFPRGAQGSLRARRLASSNTEGLRSLCLELQEGELWTLPSTFDATSTSSGSILLSPEGGSMQAPEAETYLDENTQNGAADASLKRPFENVEDQLCAPGAKVLKASDPLHVHQSLGLQETQQSDIHDHLLLGSCAEDFAPTTCQHRYTVHSSGLPCADKALLSGQQDLMPLSTPELQPSSQDASKMWPAHLTGPERYADVYVAYEVEASHSTHPPGLEQHVEGAPSVYSHPVEKFRQQFDEDVLDQVALPSTMQATFQPKISPQEALRGAFSISSDQVNTPQQLPMQESTALHGAFSISSNQVNTPLQYTDTHGAHGRGPSEETLFISSEAEQQFPMQGSTALHGAFSIFSNQVNTPQQYTDTHGAHGKGPSEETLFISLEPKQQLPMQGSTALHGAFSVYSGQVNTPQQYTGAHGKGPSEETLFVSSEAEQQLPMQGSTMASYEVSKSQQRHDEHATSEDVYSSRASATQIAYELQLYLEESYTPSPGSANEPPQYTVVHDIREVSSGYPGLTPPLQSEQQLHARGSFTVRLEQGAGFSNEAELHAPQGFSGTQEQKVSTQGSEEKVSHHPHLAALLFGGDESSSMGEASHSSSSTDLEGNDEKEEDPPASHMHCATLRKMLLAKPTGANTIERELAAHPYVRLPLLDSGVKLPPSSEPSPRCTTCPRFLARELLILRNIFRSPFIGLQQARQITRIASRLEFHARTFMVNEPPSRPSAAVEVLGRRFLMLNAIYSIKKVLGNQVQWDNWFSHLVRDVPTDYTQVPTPTTADFSLALYSFAVELSAAMKLYRMGSAPSDVTVLRIKQKLFCSPKIPRCFRKEEWAAFRCDHYTPGSPCES
ncbi:hypothetical protein, conserved [Eimeria tenella]|uniref:Uncharacterized protein n=1 Tax=Eimeria tenella TaxID=5802 RepID=U6KV93_EIMTE|nr:hypothetical protein, conserved [Eimeria tenella]CDJ40284.1 hypothetical protein, conserved [Eimeria tenella]|eukprot:XP_013231037.1 hypothetical protein, conserved [Eimeria tenella]